ncbi:MAG: tetratricopeptide repeat protein [Treponema sp.]|jgi:tetratricopeptide (TPR) repeat protein|nr:tetratricopeptide repeat protein [Treponema sp.]
MKKIPLVFAFIFLLFLPLRLFGQRAAHPYWYTLEQGKTFFRNGQYGGALNAFEDAKRNRRTMYEKMEQDLIYVLSLSEVRRMRDSLDEVERYIAKNYLDNAATALKELYFRVPRQSLNGSANNALKTFGTLKAYPEAEYWIGEVYRIEGELNLAVRQYQKAHEQRANLENPHFDIDILYRIVDVFRITQDYNAMEEWALSILATDALWSGGSAQLYARGAMSKLLESDGGIKRFLTVYRYDNAQVERIHQLLGFFYYNSGRHGNAQEHLMFSFLINSTLIINELLRNRYDFEFVSLEAMLEEAEADPVLIDFIDSTDYYKTVYYLACALYANGKATTARELWNVLSERRVVAGEWAARSANQLKSPAIESPREAL